MPSGEVALSCGESSCDSLEYASGCQCDGGQPKNFLRPCLLLLLGEEPSHGYELLDRTTDFGFSRDPGGLYRVLRAIEREGLVASHWVASDSGPDRRLYQLTPSGREWLHAWARTLDETRKTLEDYLVRYRTLSDRETRDNHHEEQPGPRRGGSVAIDSRDVFDSIVRSKPV